MRACSSVLARAMLPVPGHIPQAPLVPEPFKSQARWMRPWPGPRLYQFGALEPGELPRYREPNPLREADRHFTVDEFIAGQGVVIRPAMIVPGLPTIDAFGAPIQRDRVQVSAIVHRLGGPMNTATLILAVFAEPVGSRMGAAEVNIIGPSRAAPGVSQVIDAMPGQLIRAEISIDQPGATRWQLTMSATWLPVATAESGDA